MRAVEGMLSDVVSSITNFVLNGMLPWMWDHKFWVMVLVPLIAIIAIAKWMWD